MTIPVQVEGLPPMEFPDGTDQSVIDSTVKRELAAKQPVPAAAPAAAAPKPAEKPAEAPKGGEPLAGMGPTEYAVGTAETLGHMGSSVIGSLAGGLTYVGALMGTQDPAAAEELRKTTQDILTYSPLTKTGKAQSEGFDIAIGALPAGARKLADKALDALSQPSKVMVNPKTGVPTHTIEGLSPEVAAGLAESIDMAVNVFVPAELGKGFAMAEASPVRDAGSIVDKPKYRINNDTGKWEQVLTAPQNQVVRQIRELGPAPELKVDYTGITPVNAFIRLFQPAAAWLDPFALSSKEAAEVGKTYANYERAVAYRKQAQLGLLNKHFTEERLNVMYDAVAEESLAQKRGESAGPGRGYDRLNELEKAVTQELVRQGTELGARAARHGILDDPMEIWDPRVLILRTDGAEGGAVFLDSAKRGHVPAPEGGGVTTSSPHLKARKYETTEETEAAAQEKFGQDNVRVWRDLRALTWAHTSLERALLGRELIDSVERMDVGGQPAISTVPAPGYQQIKSRVFKRNKFVGSSEGDMGQTNRVFAQVDSYAHPDVFPMIDALTHRNPGAFISAYAKLKNFQMHAIMLSPLVHKTVIYAKAFPAFGEVVATQVLTERFAHLLQDPGFVKQAIQDGVVPATGWKAQVTGIPEWVDQRTGEPAIQWSTAMFENIERSMELETAMGRSGHGSAVYASLKSMDTLAKSRAAKMAADYVKKAGKIWHERFLWEKVSQLQLGIYDKVRGDLMNKGFSPAQAGPIAAKVANRYGGMIPREDMGRAATGLANLVMFSRTFNFTNIGIWRDIATGMDNATASRIESAAVDAQKDLAKANRYLRMKQFGAVIKDMAMMYGLNSVLQSAMNAFQQPAKAVGLKPVNQQENIEDGYIRRLVHEYLEIQKNPTLVLRPDKLLQMASPGGDHEPGKENRLLLGFEPGFERGVYAKPAFGKTAEDLMNMMGVVLGEKKPSEVFGPKASPGLQFVLDVAMNDRGFGRKLYDPSESVLSLKNAGLIAKDFMDRSFNTDVYTGMIDVAKGKEGAALEELRAVGSMTGFSISQGFPGGPGAGIAHQVKGRGQFDKEQAVLKIKDAIRAGNMDEAENIARQAQIPGKDFNRIVKGLYPHGTPFKGKVGRGTTPEDMYRYEHEPKP